MTKKIFIHLIIPLMISLILIWSYFFGSDRLQQIVSPHINREYGLLENLQVIELLAIVVITAYGLKRKILRVDRMLMGCIMVIAIFIFLEEIDYGLHYYRYLSGRPLDERLGSAYFNIHNIGEATSRFKNVGDTVMILLFIIFPLVFAKSKNPLIRYITPDRFFIATMIIMVAISKLAHRLEDLGVGNPGTLHGRISEFRELIIYYIFLVYFFELIFRRNYSPSLNKEKPNSEVSFS